jgi:hypothetical protein
VQFFVMILDIQISPNPMLICVSFSLLPHEQATLDFTLTVIHPYVAPTIDELQEQRGMIRNRGPGSIASAAAAFPFGGRSSPSIEGNGNRAAAGSASDEESAFLSLCTQNADEFFEIDFVFHLQDLVLDLQRVADMD